MSSIQRLSVVNFQIPPGGLTDCMGILLPDTGSFPPDGYTIDWLSIAQIIPGPQFIPQACTIDASSLAAGASILFTVEQINFRKKILAGVTATFQFPALRNLRTNVLPSDGTSSFMTHWYNYPALPDCCCGSAT